MKEKRPKGRPEPIGHLLDKALPGSELVTRLKDLAIWQGWQQVVGETIASRATPLRLIGGVLTVLVNSAPWMQQLNFMKPELISRLNMLLGEERVKQIVLKSGSLPKGSGTENGSQKTAKTVSKEQQHWIDRQLEGLDDKELKESLQKLMEQHYSYR